MQALVRVQARVRARRVRLSLESERAQQKIHQQLTNETHIREIEVSDILLLGTISLYHDDNLLILHFFMKLLIRCGC